MSLEEIAKQENLVNKLKFKASQKASDLHDLIEDRLLTDFEDIPEFAEETYAACKEWKEKKIELEKMKSA
ncbi:CCE_0567 family metalloprotein [Sunxiuqinia sp. A32]|uniref:CCE_0567 family metalloprotein n=1 Tax=Sunxiuqinia sp. A32 TaxID=3461496 RepID=UPI004045C320